MRSSLPWVGCFREEDACGLPQGTEKKMSASYERQVKQWMASDPAQLIAAAEDIAAIRFIHENLVDTISDEDASFLLTLDDPLGDVSSKWVEENGSDMVHDDDIHHCIWSLWEECTDGQTQKKMVFTS